MATNSYGVTEARLCVIMRGNPQDDNSQVTTPRYTARTTQEPQALHARVTKADLLLFV